VTLFLIRFLDDPVKAGYGALQPVAMERTLGVLARERRLCGPERAAPLRRERGPGPVSRADHPHRTMPDGGLGAIVHRVNLGPETRPARAA
jgi:hypothetical protein